MGATATILLMAVVTYIPRFAGFLLLGRTVPPFWVRFLRFVPISVFAVLIVPALPGTGSLSARLGAGAVAGTTTLGTRSACDPTCPSARRGDLKRQKAALLGGGMLSSRE